MKPKPAAAIAMVAAAVFAGCADDGPSAGVRPFAGRAGACPPILGYPLPVNAHGSADFAGAAIVEITAGDGFFAPTCAINLPVGTVTLRVTNVGTNKHNVTIRDQGVDVDVLPGQTVDVDVEVGGASAPLVFFCKYHRTSGMVGALISRT